MPFPKMGHAIIINNVISEKPGTKKDVEALEATYKTLGFDVHVHNDCNDTVKTSHVKDGWAITVFNQWRIYTDKFWKPLPLSTQYSSFSCSFWKHLTK